MDTRDMETAILRSNVPNAPAIAMRLAVLDILATIAVGANRDRQRQVIVDTLRQAGWTPRVGFDHLGGTIDLRGAPVITVVSTPAERGA